MKTKDTFFIPFKPSTKVFPIPSRFALYEGDLHPLCERAAEELQEYLKDQKEWKHNFGLSPGQEGIVIGKMFGVLAVQTQQKEIGYLAAFSGKLAGGNHHAKFVPPVFDLLTDKSFLNQGMQELTRMNEEIAILEECKSAAYDEQIHLLKTARKKHSISLQKEIFDHYHFLNQAGEEKSLNAIFATASYKNPPSGAGECAGPKLLQYAFLHHMKPLAMAEFWWGESPKSDFWKHGHFYPCCQEKCEPILAHMLEGIDDKENTWLP
ncbi:MAG: Pseudouridylate synthase [Chitinophagaceae bacterium]|nr:Pseudouridylate synthase [Chitinophagaceae bacterium]